MIVPDVNVLVYAAREAVPEHAKYREWLEQTLAGIEPVGFSELVLSGVVRILTHPRVFDDPLTTDQALAFTEALRVHPTAVPLRAGERHWAIFSTLAAETRCRGNLVSDAYHAALAIEHGGLWVTTDRDFARFPGLRWKHPLG